MAWKEICSTIKKCSTGYKIARSQDDTETQEYYTDIISGIIEGPGYRPMKFRINDGTSGDEGYRVFDEGADGQEHVAEEQELAEIEQQIHKRRTMAIEYGKKFKRFDWDEITQGYVTYITPEESAEGYLVAIAEDQEVQYEAI
jgi:hypothetical protein